MERDGDQGPDAASIVRLYLPLYCASLTFPLEACFLLESQI